MEITFEAIFDHGVLRPVQQLPLVDQQRVRLTLDIERRPSTVDDDAARRRLIEVFEQSPLRTNGSLPSRDELHER